MRSSALSLAIGVAAWLASTGLRAEETADLQGLLDQTVVTSASQSAETTDSAPATAVTISADDLRRQGIRTVDEAIRFLASGISLLELPYAHVNARGVAFSFDYGSHLLVLVDGQGANSQLDGRVDLDRSLFLPIELVDHIEVILGPGSVLYGSNAMQGVVNVVTKRAGDLHHLHLALDSELGRLYRASAASGFTFRALGQPAGLVLGIEHTDERHGVDFPRMYLGVDDYTGEPLRTRPGGPADGIWGGRWDNYYARTTAAYARLTRGRLQLGARLGTQRSSDPGIFFDFDNPDAHYLRSRVGLDLQYGLLLSQHLEFSFRLYGDSYRDGSYWRSSAAEYCLPGQVAGCQVNIVAGGEWLGADVQSRIDWFGNARQVTLLGVEAQLRNTAAVVDIIDAATGVNPGSVSYQADVDSVIGAYAQHVARLAPGLRLNLGARFDSYQRFGTALSPRAALILAPWEHTTFKAIYSTAFRAPPPSMMAVALPLLIVKADSVENERVQAFELVGEQRLGTQHISTSLFLTEWQDLIELVRLSDEDLARAKAEGKILAFLPSAYQYRNVSHVEDLGYTLGYDGSLLTGRLRYGASATEAFVRREVGGRSAELFGAPSLFGNAHLSYDFGSPWPTLGVAAQASGRTLVFNADQSAYPVPPSVAPRLLTLVNLSGPMPALGDLQYRLGVRFANHGDSPASLNKTSASPGSSPVLFPLDTFRVLIGLEYAHDL